MVAEAALVARRLAEIRESGCVDLSGCGLRSIPQALYMFAKDVEVTVVDVSNNQLQQLPGKLLTSFPGLKEFKCSNNTISVFPQAELAQLNCVETVDFSSNKLTTLPSLLPASLKTLVLSDNCIEDVSPEEIEKCSDASAQIHLSGNNLNPETVSRLQLIPNFHLN